MIVPSFGSCSRPCRLQICGQHHHHVVLGVQRPVQMRSRRHKHGCRTPCQAAYGDAAAAPVEDITSLQNSLVKHCVKVRQNSRYREEAGTVILSGADLVLEVAECATIKVLFVVQGQTVPGIRAARVVLVTPEVMRKVTGMETVAPSTLAAEVTLPAPTDFWAGRRPGEVQRLLVLDRVQDPGNLGTLLRTALALGWGGALLLPGCCDPFNEKALRAARGAPFKLPLLEGTLGDLARVAARHQLVCLAAEPHSGASASGRQPAAAAAADPALLQLHGGGHGPAEGAGDDQWEGWLYGGDGAGAGGNGGGQARPAGEQQSGVCLVLGSEGQGLSEGVLDLCTPLTIPMAGDMESLNVAAAGAILMFALSAGAPTLQASLGALLGGQQQQQQDRAQTEEQPRQQQPQPQQRGRVPERRQQQGAQGQGGAGAAAGRRRAGAY